MKYLIMECHVAYAVVLSDDGRFLKVANMHYEIGQTVTNVVEMVLPQADTHPQKQIFHMWIPILVSMAACLVLVFSGFFMNYVPYASVYMSINPEVRIDVSRTDRVLDVTGVNADGIELLQGYEHGGDDLDMVMDELVDRAIDIGYLHEGGIITLTLDANDKWVTSHETELNGHLTQHLEDKISVTIDIIPHKPMQDRPFQNTSDGQSVVIPVDSESNYGASDYGSEIESENSDYSNLSDSGFGADGDSGYDNTDSKYDNADSKYGETTSSGASGYDVPDVEEESDYDASDYVSDSVYEEPELDDDSDSEYDD